MTFRKERAPAAGTDRGTGQTNGRGLQGNHSAVFHAQQPDAEVVLSRIEGVRKAGSGWSARCPAHDDRSASLSVTQAGDRVLIHCFAGCRPDDVLTAIGLTWANIMPPRNWPDSPSERRAQRQAIREAGWRSALAVLAVEATVTKIAAKQVQRGEALDADDWQRLCMACDRIDGAAAVMVEASAWRPGGPA